MKRILIFLCIVMFSMSSFADEMETKVLIKTNIGKITVKLYNETPLHRDNFIKLVQENQYDSIMFHRVIKLFMIQAGEKFPPSDEVVVIETDTENLGKWKQFFNKFSFLAFWNKDQQLTSWRDPNYVAPDHKIPAEIVFPKYFHKRGQLCAARTDDSVNPTRESSGFQFYIVTGQYYTDHELDKLEISRNVTFTKAQREAYKFEGGRPDLDGFYTIFGEVTKGLKVVQKIELTSTNNRDRPLKDIRIKTMKILK